MRILDRYIIRELAIPILYCSIALIFLILIADVFDNMDDMIRNHTKAIYILQYYVSLIPIYFAETIAWASLLGTIYLLVHFNHHNETIAMKAVGLSISQIARPVIYVGLLAGIVTFLVADRIVPKTYLLAENILNTKIKKRDAGEDIGHSFRDLTYSSRKGRLYYVGAFDPVQNRFENVIVIFLDANRNINRRVSAKSGYYRKGKWYLEKVTSYVTDPQGKLIGDPDHFEIREYPEIEETPQDFKEAGADERFLSYRELQGHIRKLQETGISAASERSDLQAKLATPWQSLVMILVALIFLAKTHKRKAMALQVLFCLMVIFTYYVTNALFMAIGKSGAISPFVSAWAANLIFGIVGILLFERGNA
jgi:lipopolysaccharide export system permease protein